MRFEEYVEEWKAGQRHLAASSLRHLDSLLEHHLYPALGSRRMNSFDHKVVDGSIRTLERNGAGLATQIVQGAAVFDRQRHSVRARATKQRASPLGPVLAITSGAR
ncbi:hypothetical protein ADL25_21045 [Streptomyces sp. NRRL F-5122]|uniref:hypothetical protein n=1 Tax=Streptomyces sp. NRRL F-5122 TaxID=1609098 RepID=UPI0007410529|nr:hypothetical protein [Streptomyces sp. NRRL F-5122]KUJ38759.1 hypothetical protein ADL25_21045 [Streptomyces sp. NRRL F-5122]